MKKRNFLLSTMLSTLLLTASLSGQQQMECKHGKCFINLSKFTPSKHLSATVHHFKRIKIASLTPEKNLEPKTIKMATATTTNNQNESDIIAFDHSTYVMQKNEQLEQIDDNGVETIVFSPSKYIMTQAEIKQYYKQLSVNEEELTVHMAIADKENKKIGDKIIEKTTLPISDYYCENQKKAVYNQELKTYQCTI